ncbi:MAG: transposase zinc-binding domain-containing protein [Planctomycetes bacterium]|nr:transposase zinc-binding domain-containing protein [Planctomycetota bacterium]
MAPFERGLAAGERSVPGFCQRELKMFLRRGILANGNACVHCGDCGKDNAIAFSCKGRGFCLSCATWRMVDTAAWLVDRVIPEAPVVRARRRDRLGRGRTGRADPRPGAARALRRLGKWPADGEELEVGSSLHCRSS